MAVIKTFKDLEVYNLSHKLAMEIFVITQKFPVEEKYSLTDQIRRSSRSVTVNIAEGWGKRKYEQLFKKHLIDSIGSLEETKAWISFAVDCSYITEEKYKLIIQACEEIGGKLFRLHDNWKS